MIVTAIVPTLAQFVVDPLYSSWTAVVVALAGRNGANDQPQDKQCRPGAHSCLQRLRPLWVRYMRYMRYVMSAW
jgi:hypothetical protein